jgi:hypothetical protein
MIFPLPRLAVLGLALLLGACVSTDATLRYSAPGPDKPAATGPAGVPAVGAVTATDRRKEEPRRLGTILGGYGNPLKILNTVRPVKDEVAAVFAEGLRARGLLAEANPRFRVDLLIRRYDTDQYMGMGSRIDLDLTLVDLQSNQPVYRDTVKDERSEVRFFSSGIFGSLEDMQAQVQGLLNATVDRMLDNPGFRAALAR